MDFEQLKPKLNELETKFAQAGDSQNARKINQLINKLEKGTFIIAFCGHFSAGKSSMINRFMGHQVLPSSPIPTSANVVTIERGLSGAMVTRRDGTSFSMALSELNKLREYAADGQAIETIQIQHESDFLPERVQLMDTPGIDSTDDAHKVAAESALHLADLVLYVMDYNHVQSEVNFGFTKTLKDRGKAVWLVVNQIDKHNEFELPFASYAKSVKESYAAWGIEPDGIFFTSLRETEHPHNRFGALQEALHSLFPEKDLLLRSSIMQSALHLIEEHVQAQSEQLEPTRQEYLQVLAETGGDGESPGELDVEALREQVIRLEKTMGEKQALPERLREDMERQLQSLIENATLTPFQTTELCGKYLESRGPRFRVGLFFAGSKTDRERERRLQDLHNDFTGKVAANLDWHFKDLLVTLPESYGVKNEVYAKSVYDITIEITPEMLGAWVKEGALASTEYMYQYAKDISAEVKAMYRRIAAEFVEKAVKMAQSFGSMEAEGDAIKLSTLKKRLQAAVGLEHLERKIASYKSELMDLFKEEQHLSEQVSFLYRRGSGDLHFMQSTGVETNRGRSGDTLGMADGYPPLTVTESARPVHFKASLIDAAGKLRQAAERIRDIPGMQVMSSHMLARAERLEQNLFTVALFGAFSAGKSSFANAMMGELVLPVSPNPTTATINKILPPTSDWPHGSVRVKLKTNADIAADIRGSLAVLGHHMEGSLTDAEDPENARDRFFAEVLQLTAGLEPVEVPPNAKPHFSFLKAVEIGYAAIQDQLGMELHVDVDTFREYVAREEKACFVEWIELYYDCPLTREGIVLIDTPGADSINARHTKVAFEYIKNADAVLFVTYYNHAFSNADREFLIQLGRVKDTFEMDKMFFLVNAADLAADVEELADVVSHVRKNLVSCGVSKPRIYPVSSQMALLARLAEKGALPASAERVYRKLTGTWKQNLAPSPAEIVNRSGIRKFEDDFLSFTIEELTEVAVQAAEAEIRRASASLGELIENARADDSVRRQKIKDLQDSLKRVRLEAESVEYDSEIRAIEKEIDELLYYVRQRVFLRYYDAFNESFSSSVLRDDAKNIKRVLAGCLEELVRFLAFDLGQEMRATSVRVEKQVNQGASRIYDKWAALVQTHLHGCQCEPYQKRSFPIPEFAAELAGTSSDRFSGALAIYKNARDFFERDAKSTMREEIEKLLQEPVAAYLEEGSRILRDQYLAAFHTVVAETKQQLIDEATEYAKGLLAALSQNVDMEALLQTERWISQLAGKTSVQSA
ncbi:dynamin family protein [Effusibacillus lacus]|uniref:Dynamin family protein n=1 Tax=Effusibacillus lacus TaxID=1348429 RepID=A0A292YE86_9BACL|nr:dynamin family protein [Effusibacillus lacus]TCS76891.1 small GTP-binding protein [Effusibacillus lacus]GAX91222.1 dynamin family protein [Effusibacillus lacus]